MSTGDQYPLHVFNQRYRVPVWGFGPRDKAARDVVTVLPAMGVRASFYFRLAEALVEEDAATAVVVLEQRGQGASSARPSRRSDWGYRELAQDVLEVLTWLRKEHPAARQTLFGHSLGGHLCLACAALAPQQVDGLALVASGSPHKAYFHGTMGRQLRLGLWTMPVVEAALGYFPGKRTGFAGNEARTVMRDWRQLVRHDRFRCAGLPEDLEERMASYKGPVLGVRLERDTWVPEPAAVSFYRKLGGAELTRLVLGENDLGCPAGHFDWAKRPARVCREVTQWLAVLRG